MGAARLNLAAIAFSSLLLAACGGGEPSDTGTSASDKVRATALLTEVSPGPGYFVDAVNGIDGSSIAGTFEAPWRTLAYAKTRMTGLTSGTGLYLRCGQVWRESLELVYQQLGTGGGKIASYGSNCTAKAKISGADDFSGNWSRETTGSNVWVRTVTTSTPIQRLFINNVTVRPAQWPNFVQNGQEFAKVDSSASASNTQVVANIADANILGSQPVGEIKEAVIHIRSEPYLVETSTVDSYTSSTRTITLKTATAHSINPTEGYVLQGKRWMLDAPGEFYHDVANGKLYVYLSSTDSAANLLNTATVEGAVRTVGLSIMASSRAIHIQNIAFEKTAGDGLFLNTPEVVVDGIEASYNTNAGVRAAVTSDWISGNQRAAVIKNSLFHDNWVYGIHASYTRSADITGNTVTDTGTIGYAGGFSSANANGTSAAIGIGGESTASLNVIQRTAKIGILFQAQGTSTVIQNNDVRDYCVRLSDCGGIYTWNGQHNNAHSAKVLGNRIWNADANLEGATGSASVIVAGVYLDDESKSVEVNGNLMANAPVGVYVHNGAGHTIANNKIWLTRLAGVWGNMDKTDADHNANTVYTGNQIVPVVTTSGSYPAIPVFNPSYAIRNDNRVGTAPPSSSTMFANNQIVQLNGASQAMVYTSWGSGSTFETFTAAAWQARLTGEATPSTPATFALYSATLGSALTSGGDFSSGLGAWGYSVSGSGALSWVASTTGCDLGCLSFTAGNQGDRVSSPTLSLSADTLYAISLSAAFPSGSARVRPWIAETSGYTDVSGTILSPQTLLGHTADQLKYEGLFKTPTSLPTSAAKIMLQLVGYNVPVLLDSVSIKPLTGYQRSQYPDYAAIAVADRASGSVASCGSFNWAGACTLIDVDGNAAALNSGVALAAGEYRLFLRTDSAWYRP